MKIAYLSTSTIPSQSANSIHVMRMSRAIAELGHSLTLFGISGDPLPEAGADPFDYYGVPRVFDLRLLPLHGYRGSSWVYSARAAILAKRARVDLAYGRDLRGCTIAAFLGLRTAFEAHDVEPLMRPGQQRAFERLVRARTFTKLVVISRELGNAVAKIFPDVAASIVVAPDGADPIREDVRPAVIPSSAGKLRVGYVGHLYQGKGIELIKKIAENASWAEFHLIGGDPETLARVRSDPSLPANVFLHGFVSPRDCDSYRGAFDVLIAPYQRSVFTRTGRQDIAKWMSPLKIFEYMASGKPIVCSDLPVLREILVDRDTALLRNPDKPSSWVRALRELHCDERLRTQLGARARHEFLQHYSWSSRAANVLKEIGGGSE